MNSKVPIILAGFFFLCWHPGYSLGTGPSSDGLGLVEVEPAIVGNPKEVKPGEYEGVVFLRFRNYTEDGRSKLCTGTLISPRTVLTAGHCLYNLSSPYSKKDYTKYPQEIVAWAGVVISTAIDPNDPRSGRIIANGAQAAMWHPKWQGGAPSDAVDMGLILLPPGASDGIKPYGCNSIPPNTGGKGVIVGYGITKASKGIVKNMGITQIRRVTERIIGIGGESSICSGDSGGPLFVEFEGNLEVAGVASRTTFDCNPRAGSATRVDTHLSWIEAVMRQWEGTIADIPIPMLEQVMAEVLASQGELVIPEVSDAVWLDPISILPVQPANRP